ncbi:MAG: histidinol dehydrogenase [Sphingomicrobium sp.]
MQRLVWNELDQEDRRAALARPVARASDQLVANVRGIVDDVRARGWDALVEQAVRIDGQEPREVDTAPLAEQARRTLDAEQLAAIELARDNIQRFHEFMVPSDQGMETQPGLSVGKIWRPLDRAGLYVPGGNAPLFSTLLMLALPARAAGVREIVVCSPPTSAGSVNPMIALAAELCGIETLWSVGGAQAIAAMAFGAGLIARVDKICGPGNAYVAAAKTHVASLSGGPAIDMPAGPSELLVIADESASAAVVAADLLSQAEHDRTAQVLLVTPSGELATRVELEVQGQLATLPRADIARDALGHARVIVTRSLDEAVVVANAYAPEHLTLSVDDPDALLPHINNAGAIFAGHSAAETFGDYLAGSSHVLPTDGAARAWSGISVYSFMKAISIQKLTAEAVARVAPAAAALARLEGLEAHARAAEARIGRNS